MESQSAPSRGAPGWLWDTLAVICASLTGLVCLLYGLIFAFPEFVPARLRPATAAPVSTIVPAGMANPTEPFPTLPAEWTAAFATRLTPPAVTRTPAAATRAATSAHSPTPTRAKTVTPGTAALSPSLPAAATATATEPAATPTTPPPTDTDTPPPASPQPTSSSGGYPGASQPTPTSQPAGGYP